MPGLQGLIRALLAPARRVHDAAGRSVESMQRDAPAAKMIGEFTVKHGVRELMRRINGRGTGA